MNIVGQLSSIKKLLPLLTRDNKYLCIVSIRYVDVYFIVIQSINISGDVLIGQLVYIILYVTIVGLVPTSKVYRIINISTRYNL